MKNDPEDPRSRAGTHMAAMGLARKAGLAFLAVLAAGCGCPANPCEEPFHLNGWCATSGTCELDGQLVTDCSCCGETPECPLWELPPETTLSIPLAGVRATLGARNDLEISFAFSESGPSIADATLLFDGQPETTCTREEGVIRCPDVAPEVTSMSFRYGGEGLTGKTFLVYVFMHDLECESTQEPCGL